MYTTIDRTTDATTVATALAKHLEQAWNRADGTAFGEVFAEDSDFVNILGEHHRGRAAIAAGHQAIFDTIYAGSTVRYTITQARALDDRVILGHVSATLTVPSGPLAGEINALLSLVVVRGGDEHRIAAFHNTVVA